MKLVPRTLLGRTVLVIGCVLIASQAAVFGLVRAYTRGPLLDQMASLVARQLHTIAAALETLSDSQREDFLDMLEDVDGIRVIPDLAGNLPSNEPQSPVLQTFADSLKAQLGEDTEFFVQKEHGKALWVRLRVGTDKYWVSIPRSQIERTPPWLWLGWAAFSALLVLLGAYALVRRVNQPLRKLAEAAKHLGAGKTPPTLPVAGPAEIREVSHAFNQMADDIRRHDDERALLLAGVSHDVRTPLARLRVGLEVAGDDLDGELRSGMIEDIEEIDAIVGQFLDFARATAEELPQAVQLNSVVEATAKRYAGLGHPVQVEVGAAACPQPAPARHSAPARQPCRQCRQVCRRRDPHLHGDRGRARSPVGARPWARNSTRPGGAAEASVHPYGKRAHRRGPRGSRSGYRGPHRRHSRRGARADASRRRRTGSAHHLPSRGGGELILCSLNPAIFPRWRSNV